MELELWQSIILAVLTAGLTIEIIGLFWNRRRWSLRIVKLSLSEYWLCSFNLLRLIRNDVFIRFGDFNHDRFCFTLSAAVMFALKEYPTTRLVRGLVCKKGKNQPVHRHSWVEVRKYCFWWVVDPAYVPGGCMSRRLFYKIWQPKVSYTYTATQFWQDRVAHDLWRAMRKRETSGVFVNIYHHYTPRRQGSDLDSTFDLRLESTQHEELALPESGYYYGFSPRLPFQFSHQIIRDFLVKPTRTLPKRRSLRIAAAQKRQRQRILVKQEKEEAPA